MEHSGKSELKFTGERLTTERGFSDGAIEHLHRYSFASLFVKNKIVLDIASGEGYGSNLLAASAASVTGVDIDQASVTHATANYPRSNLKFIHGSCLNIPLPDKSVDVVVSFETIEHLVEQDQMMSEFKRVLRPDGRLVLSSPEKKFYYKVDPDNPFHLKELFLDELKTLVDKYFKHSNYYFQRTKLGSIIIPHDLTPDSFSEASGDFEAVAINKEFFEPMYNLVVCSDQGSEHKGMLSFFRDEKSLALRIERRVTQVRTRMEYKIGNWVLYPVRLYRRWFHGKG